MASAVEINFEKSKGGKLSFYAELGQYFSPDGSFDEFSFNEILSEHLSSIKDKCKIDEEFQEKAHSWVSEYISEIILYLKNKNMINGAFSLFKAAVEKCAKMDIPSLNIPSSFLSDIISNVNIFQSNEENKKNSKDDKRNQIFQAALQVFSEDGFYKATMDKVATLSGVAKGSLYRYFKSKEELLEQLLEEEYSKIVSKIGGIFSRNTDVLTGIQEMIEYWISFINDNIEVYKLIQSADITTNNLGGKTKFYRYMSEHLPMLKERVVTLNREDRLKSTSFYAVFYGIFGFVDGVVHKWMSCGMDYPLMEETPIILETIFNGFVGESVTKRNFYIPSE